MSVNQQSKSEFIIDNFFIFFGIIIFVVGVFLGLDYEFNDEVQNAEYELKQTSYRELVLIGESLMTLGYWVMIVGGILLSILGYSLKRLLK